MDLDIYDYKTALDLDFTLTKAERLQVRFEPFVGGNGAFFLVVLRILN